MSPSFTRFVACLLLAFGVIAFVGLHYPQMPVESAASDACPHHHHTPAPAPDSHECCVAGHSAVIVPSVYRVGVVALHFSSVSTDRLLPNSRDTRVPALPGIRSRSSSDHLPLRV